MSADRAIIGSLRAGGIRSANAKGNRVLLDAAKTRGLMLVAADRIEALQAAALGMRRIVEEIDGAMNHGTWRDDKGMRIKDTPEWVALYLAIKGETP